MQKKIDLDSFIHTPDASNEILNYKQRAYLKEKKRVTVCIDPNWMPYEKFDENREHVGMSADYFKLFQKTLQIDFEIIETSTWSQSLNFAKSRECDILSLAMKTPQRENYLNFTAPYLKIPIVITTKTDVPFMNDIGSITNKRVATPKGYALIEILKEKYPKLKIVEVENITQGLKKVDSGDVFGYIGTIASVSYELQNKFYDNLKIAGKLDEYLELGVGVRNDDKTLLEIMQKAVKSTTINDKQEILNRWISVKYEKGIDYRIVYKTIFGFTLLVLIISYFLMRQRRLTAKIKHLNDNLEIKISKALQENTKQHQMLQQQTKMAQMGEMIGAIAHQWRQPLNELGLSIQNLKYDQRAGKIDEVFIQEFIEYNKNTIMFMSKTIDDFRNFFRVDKTKRNFDIKKATTAVASMLSSQLKNHEIKLNISGESSVCNGFQSEYQQVILNIINNAKDALVENKIDNAKIDIVFKNSTVSIKDNAGGIPQDVVDRIFEPYFTTKEQGKGTGMGLYMSKMIIEDNMGGSLHVSNGDDGAIFIIDLNNLS